MLEQLFLGSVLIVITALVAAPCWWALEVQLGRTRTWMARPPHGPKLMAALCMAMF